MGPGAFNFDNPGRLQLDGLDFSHETAGVAAQERRHDAEHGGTEAADVQAAEGGSIGESGTVSSAFR